MNIRKKLWIGILLALVVTAAIGWRITQSLRAKQASSLVPKAEVVLELSPEDIQRVQLQELISAVELVGTLRASRSAFVKAKIASEIREITVREGDTVRQGQLLVRQDATEFDWRLRQAEQQAQAARAQLEIARRTFANNKALVEQGFISPTALESSASNEAAAQANLQAATAGAELARKALADAALAAPINGIVSQRFVQAGERVGVDTRLLEIVDLASLELEAALTPGDLTRVRIGQRAEISVDGVPGVIAARVARINPSAQAGSRTVAVYLSLEAHPALRHGLFAKGRIHEEKRRILALPASAVRTDRAQPYVLLLDGSSIRAQTIGTGAPASVSDGTEWLPITQGLTEGAQVLSGSAATVKEGTPWKSASPRLR